MQAEVVRNRKQKSNVDLATVRKIIKLRSYDKFAESHDAAMHVEETELPVIQTIRYNVRQKTQCPIVSQHATCTVSLSKHRGQQPVSMQTKMILTEDIIECK